MPALRITGTRAARPKAMDFVPEPKMRQNIYMVNAYVKAIAIGVVAGMRSFSAPALVSDHLVKRHSHAIANSNLSFMGSPKIAITLKIMAGGELIADKTTFIPNRIDPGPLAFRAVSGAVCGAALGTAEIKRADLGALVGGLAAVLSAHAFFLLRRKLTEETSLPKTAIALAEDSVALGIGLFVLRV